MPSTTDDQLIPDFDDIDLSPPKRQTHIEGEEALFAPSLAKRNKKKKSRKHVETSPRPVAVEQEQEAIVPVEEVEDGVRLAHDHDAAQHVAPEEIQPVILDANGFEEQQMKVESAPTIPKQPLVRASPAPSPRPALARPASSSLTPPSRPASLHSPPNQQAYLASYRAPTSTVAQARRPSHSSPVQRFVEPVAPPHMAQPHFYGLPDLGLFSPKSEQAGKPPGSDGYCCCFDSFADSGDYTSSQTARNALLVGSEGGLEVYRVLPNKFEVVGRLEGLRGKVIGAKVLSGQSVGSGVSRLTPLVAVVVHGILDDAAADAGRPVYYRTTVEVYSLQTQEHVATLFQSPAEAVDQPTIGHPSTMPKPIGDLLVTAQGRFVIVSSGKSGEIFVFTNAPTPYNTEAHFRCVGKYWTSLQNSLDKPSSRPQSSSEGGSTSEEADKRPGVPLFSLSQRWLAIVPPSTTSYISIQGTVLLPEHNQNPSGLASHVAPPPPSITCDIAGVDAEGTWGRLTRQAAQGLVKYSQRGFEMGRQGWNELVNPTTQTVAQHARGSSKDEQFPPTNAPPDDPKRESKEPSIISIIDLEALLDAEELRPKYPPAPMATFALEEGCNYLSFAYSGLRLLTVSRSGEVSTVWDLRQASHGTYAYSTPPGDVDAIHTPCVKQIIRIPRSSQAVVTDSAWSRDDDLLAILTTHGTVHLHEIPANPPSRKRKRRSTPPSAPAPGHDKAQATVGVSHSSSPPSSGNIVNGGSGLFGTLRSGFQQVTTQVSTIRSQPPSFALPTFAGFREVTAQASQAGSRALARGISQGYSAARMGAVEYLHADDNKIRHKALQQGGANGIQGSSGVIRWVKRPSGMLLAVACGGSVHLHPVARVERRRPGGVEIKGSGLKHDRHSAKRFELPGIKTAEDTTTPGRNRRADACKLAGPHGFWSLRSSSPPTIADRPIQRFSAPTQVNEVETNPPYCPFHIDSRVNIFAFGDDDDAMTGSQINLLDQQPRHHLFNHNSFLSQGHGQADEGAWLFGAELPSSVKMNTHDELPLFDGFGGGARDAFGDEGVTDSALEAVAEQVESRLTIKSVGDCE